MTPEIPVQLDLEHRRCVVGNEPMIFHCHHYNTFLQRTILDADYIDSKPALVGAAAEVAYAQLKHLFKNVSSIEERRALASKLYRWAGFGTFDLSVLGEDGGTIRTANSHYAMSWRAKWSRARAPVCFFAAGWLAGALAAIFDRPLGSYSVNHPECRAVDGHEACVFELKSGPANHALFQSVGVGPLSEKHNVRPVPPSAVDYDGILKAVATLDLTGQEDGVIRAFGVYLTRHYANYYNRISFELERALTQRFGEEGREVARPLLVEAGHVCAFNTFGGIMISSEWDALIRPNLKTKEDWVQGMIAVANALGWGRWQVTEVSEKEARFVIHDDYESVGYLAMYGKADHTVSYLAEGGVTGLMNLVYLGKIDERPELTSAYYESLFKGTEAYKAELISSRAMGDEVTSFRVYRG